MSGKRVTRSSLTPDKAGAGVSDGDVVSAEAKQTALTEDDNSASQYGNSESKSRSNDGVKKISGHVNMKELPSGWIRENRPRKGSRSSTKFDPFYIDPVSGYEFRSLKDAFRYIETGDITKCAMRPKKGTTASAKSSENEPLAGDVSTEAKPVNLNLDDNSPTVNQLGGSGPKSTSNDDIRKGIKRAEELPSGWIRVNRPRKGSVPPKFDPFYIDPVSGYEFRSSKDALRYIETGDIKKCASRPKKGSATAAATTSTTDISAEDESNAASQLKSANSQVQLGSQHVVTVDASSPPKGPALKQTVTRASPRRAAGRAGKKPANAQLNLNLPDQEEGGKVDTITDAVNIQDSSVPEKQQETTVSESGQHPLSGTTNIVDLKPAPPEVALDKHDAAPSSTVNNTWPDCIEFALKTLTSDIPVLDDTADVADHFCQKTELKGGSGSAVVSAHPAAADCNGGLGNQ